METLSPCIHTLQCLHQCLALETQNSVMVYMLICCVWYCKGSCWLLKLII